MASHASGNSPISDASVDGHVSMEVAGDEVSFSLIVIVAVVESVGPSVGDPADIVHERPYRRTPRDALRIQELKDVLKGAWEVITGLERELARERARNDRVEFNLCRSLTALSGSVVVSARGFAGSSRKLRRTLSLLLIWTRSTMALMQVSTRKRRPRGMRRRTKMRRKRRATIPVILFWLCCYLILIVLSL